MSLQTRAVLPVEDDDEAAVARQLERDGLLRREGTGYRTTRRWQAAMARASLRLLAGEELDDLRKPIAIAMVDFYGFDVTDEELARKVDAMWPIEALELDPVTHPPI